MGRHMDRVSTY